MQGNEDLIKMLMILLSPFEGLQNRGLSSHFEVHGDEYNVHSRRYCYGRGTAI